MVPWLHPTVWADGLLYVMADGGEQRTTESRCDVMSYMSITHMPGETGYGPSKWEPFWITNECESG